MESCDKHSECFRNPPQPRWLQHTHPPHRLGIARARSLRPKRVYCQTFGTLCHPSCDQIRALGMQQPPRTHRRW